MSQQPVHLNLSSDLYDRIRSIAEGRSQPVEEVVIKSLELLYGTDEAETLEQLSDKVLWIIARQILSPQDEGRLNELIAKSKEDDLPDVEQAELSALLEIEDRLMLARSKALALLKQRGHDIDRYLNLKS